MTAVRFAALDAPLGALVEGFDRLPDPADGDGRAALVEQLAAGLAANAVLVFRSGPLTATELIELGRAFGPLELLPEPDKRDPVHPEIFDLSNVGPDGRPVGFDEPQAVFLRGTERWHTDSSFRAIPCLCTMLYAREIPPTGGDTRFADMRAAYDALPEATRTAIADLVVVHDYQYSRANNPGRLEPMSEDERAKYPPVSHPLVRVHGDGRRSLYLGGHASHIEGRPRPDGRRLLAELESFATADRFVYTHRWQVDDLVVWDNRSTLHQLTPYDIARHRRVMRRITVAGTEPPVGSPIP